jgi:predicted ArsR family transcriptional regulator
LGSVSRVAILRLVRTSPTGLTTGEVAAATGLHLSTVRAHLDRLVHTGLLVKARSGDGTPGRPAWRYRSAAPEPAPGSYRDLAGALLDHLSAGDDAGSAAIRVGEGWGRRLVAGTTVGAAPVEATLRVLDGLGFAPRLAAGGRAETSDHGELAEVHLHACPFLDLVASYPDTMCGLHQGVIRGVLAESGGRPDAAVLEPFGAPTACVVRVAVPGTRGGPGPGETAPGRQDPDAGPDPDGGRVPAPVRTMTGPR